MLSLSDTDSIIAHKLVLAACQPDFGSVKNIVPQFSERENGAKPNILIGQKFHHATTVSVSATATGYHSFSWITSFAKAQRHRQEKLIEWCLDWRNRVLRFLFFSA